MERFVGDVYERKEFEYTVVAKVPHASREGIYVYLVVLRRFGEEEVQYITQEY